MAVGLNLGVDIGLKAGLECIFVLAEVGWDSVDSSLFIYLPLVMDIGIVSGVVANDSTPVADDQDTQASVESSRPVLVAFPLEIKVSGIAHPDKRYTLQAARTIAAGVQFDILEVANSLVSGKVHITTCAMGQTTYLFDVGTAAQRPKIMTNANSVAKNLAILLDLKIVLMVMDTQGRF